MCILYTPVCVRMTQRRLQLHNIAHEIQTISFNHSSHEATTKVAKQKGNSFHLFDELINKTPNRVFQYCSTFQN